MGLFARLSGASSFGDPDLNLIREEYFSLLSGASERIQRMETFREENSITRAPALQPTYTEPYDYGIGARRKSGDEVPRHRLKMPLGKALTVKHAYRIAGQLPDVIVDERAETPEERYRSDMMEKIAWAIIRDSGDTQLSSGAWDASELGSGVFDMYFSDDKQIACFRRIDPIGFVEVQGVDNPHDFQRAFRAWEAPLSSVVAMYREQLFRGEPVRVDQIQSSHRNGSVEMVKIVQMCDKGRVVRVACGSENGSTVGLYEYFHNYGFTPYVVIPNIGPYEDVWGWADFEFVRDLVHYIPALMSREADVIRTVANGAMIERGTGQSEHTVKKILQSGGVLPSKRDGTIDPIQVPEMPSFHETHSDRVMDMLKMVGFAPDAAWGLPGSGSGTDRGLQLQPLLEYTAMKQLNWQAGLSRLFGMGFQMIERNMTRNATYSGSATSSRTGKKTPFVLQLGPQMDPAEQLGQDEFGIPTVTALPRTPKELFDGDYSIRFNWRNRVDPDDPQYVMSEMSKFTQGAQSLQTTLENLGVQNPEDEMRRIEKEAERFPWVNQGLVTLLLGQIRGNAQGSGGGAPADPGAAVTGALETMSGLGGGGQSGALNTDAAAASMGVPGVPYGAA
jgi:hypothetical protein